MSDDKIYNLLNTLLLTKLMELIKKPDEEEEEQTPREKLAEMYTNPKEDVASQKVPDIDKIMEEYNGKPLDENIILQKLEALTKEKEVVAKNKEAVNIDRLRLADQQKTFKRATIESGLVSLNNTDTVELWIRGTDATPANATIKDVALSVIQLGGA